MTRRSPGRWTSTTGEYETAAGWLAAAREVAPGIALSTLQRWQIDYRRRRNLWRELSKYGFDIDIKSRKHATETGCREGTGKAVAT